MSIVIWKEDEITLSPSSDINATKIDVLWNIDMSCIPVIARGFAKDNYENNRRGT
jgi:hypothetical protein